MFSGLDAGVERDAIEPHSTTAARKTIAAMASPAALSTPLRAGSVGLLPFRARTAVPASEIAVRDLSSALQGP